MRRIPISQDQWDWLMSHHFIHSVDNLGVNGHDFLQKMQELRLAGVDDYDEAFEHVARQCFEVAADGGVIPVNSS